MGRVRYVRASPLIKQPGAATLSLTQHPLSTVLRRDAAALLTALFLSGLILRGMAGWSYPSVLLQLSAFGLIWISPLRLQVHWKRLLVWSLPFFAWAAWRDTEGGDKLSSVEGALKGMLYALALIASASMLDKRQWKIALALSTAIGLAAILVYIGSDELKRAILIGFGSDSGGLRMDSGFATRMNRNKLAIFIGMIAIWSALLVPLQLRGKQWALLILLPVTWILLLSNFGIGSIVGCCAAIAFMILMVKPRWTPPLAATLLGGIGIAYVSFPEHVNYKSLMHLRDVIYAETWPHIMKFMWEGAGSAYFKEIVSPTLSTGPKPFIHNIYLEFWLAYGLIGMALLGALITNVTRQTAPLLNTIEAQLVIGSTAAFFLTYGLVDMKPMNPYFFIGIACMGLMIHSIIRVLPNTLPLRKQPDQSVPD